jgi:hypothetical protein
VPVVITLQTACIILGRDYGALKKDARDGKFPAFKNGDKLWAVKKDDLLAYIDHQKCSNNDAKSVENKEKKIKFIIEGSPKEIAALALKIQRRPKTIIIQNSQVLSPSELAHRFQNVQRRMRKVRQSDFATLKGIPVPKASIIKAEEISGKKPDVKLYNRHLNKKFLVTGKIS